MKTKEIMSKIYCNEVGTRRSGLAIAKSDKKIARLHTTIGSMVFKTMSFFTYFSRFPWNISAALVGIFALGLNVDAAAGQGVGGVPACASVEVVPSVAGGYT